jgi:hypothetical protein
MESSRPQDRAEPDDRWKTQTGQIFTRPDRRLEPDKVLSMHLEVVGGAPCSLFVVGSTCLEFTSG